jgi:hypothetical protein
MQIPETAGSPDGIFLTEHAQLLLSSLRRLTGRDLIDPSLGGEEAGIALYHAPFVLLSHDTAPDPCFTYANLAGQRLFEMPWTEIVGLPSRLSAEPLAREERQRLLDNVGRRGFITDYNGVRISKSGRRFRITNAMVWNLLDSSNRLHGQAACFSEWQAVG